MSITKTVAPKSLGNKVPSQSIEHRIHLIRGQKVMLDADLATLYEVSTKALNQAVKRNLTRFPESFMFQLTPTETTAMRSQFVTASKRNVRFQPLAFTEHWVVMLSSVLNSDRAIQMNILIISAFVRLREMIAANKDLAARVEKLETGQNQVASVIDLIVDEIESMKALPTQPSRKIGLICSSLIGPLMRGGASWPSQDRPESALCRPVQTLTFSYSSSAVSSLRRS
jgi:ORF6N domain